MGNKMGCESDSPVSSSTDAVTGILNYSPVSSSTVTGILNYGDKFSRRSLPTPLSTQIRNARLKFENLALSFNLNGFEMVKHRTALDNSDFYQAADPNPITDTYYGEIVDAVKTHLFSNATSLRVACLGHTIRGVAAQKSFSYYSHVHTDYNDYQKVNQNLSSGSTHGFDNDWSAHKIATDAALSHFGISINDSDSDLKYTREWQLLTAWRNISDVNAIDDNHLALLDTRSVEIPEGLMQRDRHSASLESTLGDSGSTLCSQPPDSANPQTPNSVNQSFSS